MPEDRLKRLRVRGDAVGIDRRDHNARIRDLCSETAVAADNAQDPGALSLRILKGVHNRHADVPVEIAAADREDQDAVVRPDPAAREPALERIGPPRVVDAGGQLGDVVGGAVRLQAGDLPEIVDGVRGVCRAPPDPEDKQPPAAGPGLAEDLDDPIDVACIELLKNLSGLGQVVLREAHAPLRRTICDTTFAAHTHFTFSGATRAPPAGLRLPSRYPL